MPSLCQCPRKSTTDISLDVDLGIEPVSFPGLWRLLRNNSPEVQTSGQADRPCQSSNLFGNGSDSPHPHQNLETSCKGSRGPSQAGGDSLGGRGAAGAVGLPLQQAALHRKPPRQPLAPLGLGLAARVRTWGMGSVQFFTKTAASDASQLFAARRLFDLQPVACTRPGLKGGCFPRSFCGLCFGPNCA